MATAANPVVATENKSSKRRKPKAVDSAAPKSDAVRPALAEVTTNAESANGADASAGDSGDSPYVRELAKNARNLRKRLNNTVKVDQIVAANPGKSLDQLLEEKKINTDQKQQAENKPILEAQIKAIDERLGHYKKFEEDTLKRHTTETESLKKSHAQALEDAKEEAFSRAAKESDEKLRSHLLTLSRFLRAAASVRQNDEKEEEADAFEGALLLVYGGDIEAVDAMQSLINGDELIVPKTDGLPSGFSFKHVRQKSIEKATPAEPISDSTTLMNAETQATNGTTEAGVGSDPTIANASLTEIEQGDTENATSAVEIEAHSTEDIETSAIPQAAMIDSGAANEVAAAATAVPTASDPMTSSISNDWTEVPRDPAETENGLEATPAAPTTNAWADAAPEAAPASASSWAEDVPAEAPANDGFSEVPGRNRGRGRGGRGGGEFRGRGAFRGGRGRGRGDGEYRGRGGRGRGGGFRGGRGGAEGGQS